MTTKRILVTLAAVLLVPLVGASPAAAAPGPGCDNPVSTRPVVNSYTQGKGDFACRDVQEVSSKVEISYKLIKSSPYDLRDSTDWVPRANIGAAGARWSELTRFTTANCGFWMVRSWVRWKPVGASSYTMRQHIATWDPCG
jgi:hypothetical protein